MRSSLSYLHQPPPTSTTSTTSTTCFSPVSICHTGTEALNCPDKYAPPLPPADLRDPGSPDRRPDRPGRRGLGARRANGGAVRGGAGGARGNGGVGTPDGGSDGHDPPLGAGAGGFPGASGPALQLGHSGASSGDVPALLRRWVRGRGLRARRVRGDRGRARGGPSLAPAVPPHRRARGLDALDPAAHAVARGPPDPRGSGVRSAAAGAARARDGTRRRAGARARGGAAARVPRGG